MTFRVNTVVHIDRLVQERCNSSALALELSLSCTNLLMAWVQNTYFVYVKSENNVKPSKSVSGITSLQT